MSIAERNCSMTLMLHAGANPVEYDAPSRASTRQQLPATQHADPALPGGGPDRATSLGYYGHQIIEQHFGLTPDGMRFFGVLSLKSDYTGYSDMVGLRNSHDRKFPVGVSFGFAHVSSVTTSPSPAITSSSASHTANLKRRPSRPHRRDHRAASLSSARQQHRQLETLSGDAAH